ncbi:hypothetical protein Btru_034414 [Bulinus truncatus]|nr:hypothetical protein Btru_034414 [Bulinus truncatus]
MIESTHASNGLKLPKFHYKRDCSTGQDHVVAVLTDDPCAMEKLRALNRLPVDQYKSVSVILEECNQTRIDYNNPVVKLGSYAKKLQLHPLCSNVEPVAPKPTKPTHGPEQRIPPLSYEELTVLHGPIHGPVERHMVRPHNGTVYPVEYANRPPYTSPGYSAPGIKQSIGVLRIPKVPAGLSMGWVGDEEMKAPTWISPLYKPYGLGGSYGPNGPFYHIPSDTCHRPVEPSFWKQPCVYMRNAIRQKRKCNLRPKELFPKLPAMPKFTYIFKKKKAAKEEKVEQKPADETVEPAAERASGDQGKGSVDEHAERHSGDDHQDDEHSPEDKSAISIG